MGRGCRAPHWAPSLLGAGPPTHSPLQTLSVQSRPTPVLLLVFFFPFRHERYRLLSEWCFMEVLKRHYILVFLFSLLTSYNKEAIIVRGVGVDSD